MDGKAIIMNQNPVVKTGDTYVEWIGQITKYMNKNYKDIKRKITVSTDYRKPKQKKKRTLFLFDVVERNSWDWFSINRLDK